MLKINIIAVGKIKEKYLRDGIEEYKKRLSGAVSLNFIEISEGKPNSSTESIIKEESDSIASLLKGYVILLDIEGKKLTSEELSSKVFGLTVSGVSEISFVIGGSYGTGKVVKERADFRLSFGKITYPHQLMRLILTEQLYRAYTIKIGSPYHK